MMKNEKYDHSFFTVFAGMYDFLDRFSVARINNASAIKIITSKIDLDEKLTLLDVGGGTGIWSSLFLPHSSNIHCMDFVEPLLRQAREKSPHEKCSFELKSASAIDKFGKNRFDIVTASYVLHGMPEKRRREILLKMKFVAKKHIIISDDGGPIPFIP